MPLHTIALKGAAMTDFDPFADLSDDELDAMLEEGSLAEDAGLPAMPCGTDVPEASAPASSAWWRPNAGKSTLLTPATVRRLPLPRRWPRPRAAVCAPWSTARTASS